MKLVQINHLIQFYYKTGQMKVTSEEIGQAAFVQTNGGLNLTNTSSSGKSKLLTIYYPF